MYTVTIEYESTISFLRSYLPTNRSRTSYRDWLEFWCFHTIDYISHNYLLTIRNHMNYIALPGRKTTHTTSHKQRNCLSQIQIHTNYLCILEFRLCVNLLEPKNPFGERNARRISTSFHFNTEFGLCKSSNRKTLSEREMRVESQCLSISTHNNSKNGTFFFNLHRYALFPLEPHHLLQHPMFF